VRALRVLCALFAFGLCAITLGQENDNDLAKTLVGVTQRGRELYAYDQAAWHGTDAFLALHPNTEGLTRYICTKTPKGWLVTFPKWNIAHDHLIAAYEARQTEAPNVYKATAVEPSRETSDALVPMELALETALRDFQGAKRPYNDAVLPAPGGQLYVYIYPAPTENDVWPLGGDVRYTISADGKQVVEKHQMHKSILDMKYDPKQQTVAGYHTHILSDIPEDTDVLYVLERRPLMPEYVGSKRGIFVIATDGSITLTKDKN
jgi:hypothetical protein